MINRIIVLKMILKIKIPAQAGIFIILHYIYLRLASLLTWQQLLL